MAYLAVDRNGTEHIFDWSPKRAERAGWWAELCGTAKIKLPSGSIEKLIGRPLAWSDDAVVLTGSFFRKSKDCKWCVDGICMKRTMCILGQMDCPDFQPKQ